MAGPQNPLASFAKGLATSSNIEAGLTISAANQQARTDLKTNAAKKTYDSNLEALVGAGLITEEEDGNIVLAPDAIDKSWWPRHIPKVGIFFSNNFLILLIA